MRSMQFMAGRFVHYLLIPIISAAGCSGSENVSRRVGPAVAGQDAAPKCTAEPKPGLEIANGIGDTGDTLRGVVKLAFANIPGTSNYEANGGAAGVSICTATIVGMQEQILTLLTAGHCVASLYEKNKTAFLANERNFVQSTLIIREMSTTYSGGSNAYFFNAPVVIDVWANGQYIQDFERNVAAYGRPLPSPSDVAVLRVALGSLPAGFKTLSIARGSPTQGQAIILTGYGLTSCLETSSLPKVRQVGGNRVYRLDSGLISVAGFNSSNEYTAARAEAEKRLAADPNDVVAKLIATQTEWSTICGGDSGGPLLTVEDGEARVAGIASGGTDTPLSLSRLFGTPDYLDYIDSRFPQDNLLADINTAATGSKLFLQGLRDQGVVIAFAGEVISSQETQAQPPTGTTAGTDMGDSQNTQTAAAGNDSEATKAGTALPCP